MNPIVNPDIMANIEQFKRLMIGEGPRKIQMQEKSSFDPTQSLMLPSDNFSDWYAYPSLGATAQYLDLHDDTFSVKNRMEHSSLLQPVNVGANNWNCNPEETQAETETEMWQLLGKNVAQWTMQPNGQPMVPLSSLAKMSCVEVACVLLASHLLKQRQDPTDNCMLTHYNCNEIRSYVLKSDELQDMLNRCKQLECLASFNNVMPHQDAPLPSMLPMPPLKWLLPKQSKREEMYFKQQQQREKQLKKQLEKQMERQMEKHLQRQREKQMERQMERQLGKFQQKQKYLKELRVKTDLEPEQRAQSLPPPKIKPKSWVYRPKQYQRQYNGGRKRINPNHVLTAVWHPSAASDNYKLFNF